MKKIILMLMLLIGLAYAEDKINVLYWNFDKDKDFNKEKIDFEFMRETFNKNSIDLIILNNIISPNLPPRFSVPYQIFKSGDTLYSDKEAAYNILLRKYDANEKLKIKNYYYPDKHKLFFKNLINGYIINNSKIILILNFENIDENNAKNNLINLKSVISHIIKEEKIKKENILILGNLNINKELIPVNLKGFQDYFNEKGTKLKFIKERGQNKFELIKKDVFISSKKIKVEVFLNHKEILLDGRYKGKENTEKYVNKVSTYVPVKITF